MGHNKKSMNKKEMTNYSVTFIIFMTLMFTLKVSAEKVQESLQIAHNQKVKVLKKEVNQKILTDEWPEELSFGEERYEVNYTKNEKLEKYVKKLLRRYRSDYSTIIVIDNNTGDILSAVGYNKSDRKFANHLAFSTTHPSASLFKIITSATLLENGNVDNDTKFAYRGKGTTLYRYQLKPRYDRWTRHQTLENAFAHSNNVVFGKAAISKINGTSIYHMANKFGFNQRLMDGFNLSASVFNMPTNQYHLAELASGFNKQTFISPIHAALLSSIVANDGVMKKPRLIKAIHDEEGKLVWNNPEDEEKVLGPTVSLKLKEMMELVVKKGTARRVKRGLRRRIKNNLEIGGKTGSITGGIPYGKRDWLTLFAKPKDEIGDKGISIAVMNINVKKWYVRSSFLAKKVINYYYKEVRPLPPKVTGVYKK